MSTQARLLLEKLRHWRDEQARREGVEGYRILSNDALVEIVRTQARTPEALLLIQGLKEKKLARYGHDILRIMNGSTPSAPSPAPDRAAEEVLSQAGTEEKIFSVSVFLDLVNSGLKTFTARVQGEISSATERGGHWYFDIKDKVDGSILSCFVWRTTFQLFGVPLTEGMEVVVEGAPGIHKPNGRLSLRVEALSLIGEGVWRQHYEALKATLTAEGLLAAERKRSLPLFPQRIGLITSRAGEAIHDFRNNLGRFGFHISFVDTRVEGAQAVPGLLAALKKLQPLPLDVLVVIRGGGSLESLQAFNNEAVVRALAAFPVPVVSGIGHDQDVSLVDLVADRSCSTPTATARVLNYTWEEARSRLALAGRDLLWRLSNSLAASRQEIVSAAREIEDQFQLVLERFTTADTLIRRLADRLNLTLADTRHALARHGADLATSYRRVLENTSDLLRQGERILTAHDPLRPLRLGYSLVRSGGRLVRRVADVAPAADITIQLADGEAQGKITAVKAWPPDRG